MATTVTAGTIREGVRETFNRVAATPESKFRFAVGARLAERVGYPPDHLHVLPSTAVDSFTGLAYLHPHLRASVGESVLDLGCGAGLDAVLAARAVEPGGTVAGLDIADAMTTKSRRNAAAVGAVNTSFTTADAERMPFRDEAFDAALANGFFNLCPDKLTVAAELFRVLRHGGRAIIAEITFLEPQPAVALNTIDDWFR